MSYYTNEVIQSIVDFVIIMGIFGGLALAIEKRNPLFLIPSICFVAILILLHRSKKKRAERFLREKIKNLWGKEHKEKRDFLHIEKLYKFSLERKIPEFYIDDITWKDLNMDTVFEKIDHTSSLPGMQYLYNILRNPIFNGEVLEERNEIISSLQNQKEISQEIQYPLSLLGKKEGKDIFKYFKNGINIDSRPAIIYKLLSYMPYVAIAMFFINPSKALFTTIMTIMLNTTAYQLNKKKIYEDMDTFLYLGGLIKSADNITKIDTNGIDLNQEGLKELVKKIGTVRKNIAKINYNESFGSDAEILIHYYNMVFLKEPNVFFKTVKLANKYREEFFQVYNLIGKIDAYISIASYKDGLDYYREVKLIEENTDFYLSAEELYHPLLDQPVTYSFELNNMGALVTGSNASGKSTFLRTIGINSLFAQTFYFTLAKEYKSSYFKLLTSIGTTDNIVEGDSYYMAEAKSLKRILDSLDPNQPVLCILDEIFRGTNTAERISAAKEALNYMINRNACVIAATHDLELTTLVNTRYNNYHFREIIEENDIKFDYILRDGPCTTRNAIAILKHLGYPREIHEKAMEMAEKYLN